jgi:hypothetical protein
MRGREPTREEAKPKRPKSRPGPAPTLGQTAAHATWFWVYCEARGCHHSAPLKLAPPIARFGEDATNDRFQPLLRCSKCSAHNTSFRLPSWVNSAVGMAPFPGE